MRATARIRVEVRQIKYMANLSLSNMSLAKAHTLLIFHELLGKRAGTGYHGIFRRHLICLQTFTADSGNAWPCSCVSVQRAAMQISTPTWRFIWMANGARSTVKNKSRRGYRFTHNIIAKSRAKKITIMISSHNIRRSLTSAWTTL